MFTTSHTRGKIAPTVPSPTRASANNNNNNDSINKPQHFSSSSSNASSSSSHTDSIHERLSVLHQEVASHKSRKSNQEKASLAQCDTALRSFKVQFHDIEERIALQAADHRGELALLDSFIREALSKVEQTLTADSDQQYEIFNENAAIVDDKVRSLERVVFEGEGIQSEEEQMGAVRKEMSAAVEAARLLCEEEQEYANEELAELIEPVRMKTRALTEMSELEFRAIERVVEDTRAQLLGLTAPPGPRLESKKKDIAKGLKEVREGLVDIRQDREITFATLYDAVTQLSNEMLQRAKSK